MFNQLSTCILCGRMKNCPFENDINDDRVKLDRATPKVDGTLFWGTF